TTCLPCRADGDSSTTLGWALPSAFELGRVAVGERYDARLGKGVAAPRVTRVSRNGVADECCASIDLAFEPPVRGADEVTKPLRCKSGIHPIRVAKVGDPRHAQRPGQARAGEVH